VKFLGLNKVLCLSPHPDDIEFALGGSILLYEQTKFTSIVFSTGSVYDSTSDSARWKECEAYWKDVSNIEQHFLAPLLRMYSEEEWLNLLEKSFHLKNYQAILLPPDLDTHYEHRLVHNIGLAMTRVTPASVIEYRSASALDTWVPNMFVDIDTVEQDKIRRFIHFESQRKNYFEPDYLRASHTNLVSLKKHIPVTEHFRILSLYL
jgi:LmbE family N-acetylglucosaminyl deacetylase